MRDVTAELKALRLHGMTGAYSDLVEQGASAGPDSARWLTEHRKPEARTARCAASSTRCMQPSCTETKALHLSTAATSRCGLRPLVNILPAWTEAAYRRMFERWADGYTPCSHR
jgi:hypothetical protein